MQHAKSLSHLILNISTFDEPVHMKHDLICCKCHKMFFTQSLCMWSRTSLPSGMTMGVFVKYLQNGGIYSQNTWKIIASVQKLHEIQVLVQDQQQNNERVQKQNSGRLNVCHSITGNRQVSCMHTGSTDSAVCTGFPSSKHWMLPLLIPVNVELNPIMFLPAFGSKFDQNHAFFRKSLTLK